VACVFVLYCKGNGQPCLRRTAYDSAGKRREGRKESEEGGWEGRRTKETEGKGMEGQKKGAKKEQKVKGAKEEGKKVKEWDNPDYPQAAHI
jgi:hypothetical protein